jgi:hypothetical protein
MSKEPSIGFKEAQSNDTFPLESIPVGGARPTPAPLVASPLAQVGLERKECSLVRI